MGTAVAQRAYEVVYDGTGNRQAFLHARKDGIGASDCAAVLGFSKWRTPYDVWADKTGRAGEREQTQAQEWGIALERVVADRFSVRHGHRDRPLPIGRVRPTPGVLRSKLWPWLFASPDRMIEEFDVPDTDPDAPLEIKTSSAYLASDWANGATPLYYQAQSQQQQLVLFGDEALRTLSDFRPHGWLVPLIGGNDMPDPRRIDFDREFAEFMLTDLERFWVENVQGGVAPPLTLADDVNEHFPVLRGSDVVATPEVEALVEERRALQVRMGADDKRDRAIKQQIQMHMKDAAVLKTADGRVLVTWDLPQTAAKVERVIDLEALRAAHPDVAAEFTVERPKKQSRTMLFKKAGE